jgi:ABC-type oligopeptide transport system substrate-binding subunit
MRRRLGLGFAVTGLAAAVVAAALWPALAIGGAAATPRVLRLNISDTNIEYIDPALNYDFLGWRLETMTCARLLSYPDKAGAAGARLVPEVARSMPRVSDGGLTYTFRIRPGFRFSDGSPVTAGSFRRSIERALNPKMQSPAASFVSDIRGADAVLAGKAATPSGVKVAGDRLAITLTRRAPDFLSRISMLFFCAVPESLPIDDRGVTKIPGAGPYYFAEFNKRSSILLRRNPYYGGTRPQRWDEVKVAQNVGVQTSYLQVRRGDIDLDISGLPPAAQTELTRSYGINRGRYFVLPGLTIQYIALNTDRPLFRDRSMRQAVAYAIDRIGLMRLAGLNGGIPNDQLLPPGIPGYRAVTVFPNRPNLAKARALMRGRTAKAVLYAGNDPVSEAQSELIRISLGRIGIDVEVKTYTFGVQITKAGTRGEPFDMNLIGWFADYPDPYDFVNVLLYGKTIAKLNNVNTAYFDDPAFNRRMERAALTTGDARAATYASLDRDLTRAAPFVVYGNSTIREFVSDRIGCPVRSAQAGGLNLTMLCLKR